MLRLKESENDNKLRVIQSNKKVLEPLRSSSVRAGLESIASSDLESNISSRPAAIRRLLARGKSKES